MVGTRQWGEPSSKNKLPRVPSYSCFSCVNIVDVHAIICSRFVTIGVLSQNLNKTLKKKNGEGDRVQDSS